ncbi:MAG: HAMP domain-containing protein [Spirochaetales bacterium]|nr:HAMP domain-containing protein [Spirochaetales bacterium]
MIVGIGTITFFLSNRLIRTLDDLSASDMNRQADAIYAAIESLMLPGEAPLAQGFFQRLNAIDPDQQVILFRTDGEEAFQDNRTILQVNGIQMSQQFPLRETMMPMATISPEDPAFAQALGSAGVPRDVFLRETQDGRTSFRVLKPLINLPQCVVCHGADHTLRGVLQISSDTTSLVQIQRITIIFAAGGFLFLVLVLGYALTRSLHTLVLNPIKTIGEICDGVSRGNLEERVSIRHADELGLLANRINSMIEGLIERFKLSQYVSGSTIRSLQKDEQGTDVKLTLFFSDIRGFTKYSEGTSPSKVVEILNQILDLQTQIIQEEGGDIDKYVGDEIFALFEGEKGPWAALRSAQKIQLRFRELGDQLEGLGVGIGLHWGEVILGRIGSVTRGDYTVIGDRVNTAARLCSAAKAGTILMSSEIIQWLQRQKNRESVPDPRLRGPFSLRVKGKAEPLSVYVSVPELKEIRSE